MVMSRDRDDSHDCDICGDPGHETTGCESEIGPECLMPIGMCDATAAYVAALAESS
jgi:hypothetical protein